MMPENALETLMGHDANSCSGPLGWPPSLLKLSSSGGCSCPSAAPSTVVREPAPGAALAEPEEPAGRVERPGHQGRAGARLHPLRGRANHALRLRGGEDKVCAYRRGYEERHQRNDTVLRRDLPRARRGVPGNRGARDARRRPGHAARPQPRALRRRRGVQPLRRLSSRR